MLIVEYENYTIILGRNSTENFKLVSTSNPDDIWIHLSDYPSGHAVIPNSKKSKIPFKVIKKACMLVKQYSKYKHIKKLDCDVVYIKDLKIDKNSEVSI